MKEHDVVFNKKIIRHSFNRVKHSYDNYCLPQIMAGNMLIALLKNINIKFDSILDIGCGTGLITKNLHDHFALSSSNIIACDLADQLLQKTQERFNSIRLPIVCCDFDHLPFKNATTQLIFSNMVLQWSAHWNNTFKEIDRVLKPGGYLAFVLPLEKTLWEFIDIQKAIHRGETAPHFHHFNEILTNLATFNYEIKYTESKFHTFFYENSLEAFQAIKKVGASYYPPLVKNVSLKGKSFLKLLADHYPKSSEGKAPVTYHFGFFIATKMRDKDEY